MCHTNCATHKENLVKGKVIVSLTRYIIGLSQTPRPVDQTPTPTPTPALSVSVRAHRLLVARTWIDLGIPFSTFSSQAAADLFRTFKVDIPKATSMSEYIPLILDMERIEVGKLLKEGVFSLIFDGASRLGEVIAVVARIVTLDFKIYQKLISLKTLAHSADGDTLRDRKSVV